MHVTEAPSMQHEMRMVRLARQAVAEWQEASGCCGWNGGYRPKGKQAKASAQASPGAQALRSGGKGS
jgi:hypothetical protein